MAIVRAGGPAAYDIATASGDLGSVGFSQESTQKGYAGQNVISAYSRAEDSAHSSVRVSSHSVSNDGLLNYDISHAPLKALYDAPSYIASSAAPLIAKTYAAPYSYGAQAPLLTKAIAAPAAPLLAKTYAAPYSYAASTPLLAKTYAAPYSYAAASTPILTKSFAPVSAPLIAKSYISSPAPLLTKSFIPAPAPLLTKSFISAPAPLLTKSYLPPATPLLAKSYITPSASLLAAPSAPLLAKSYVAPSLEYSSQLPLIAKSGLIGTADAYTASIAPAPILTKTYSPSIIAKSAPLYNYAPQAQIISKTIEPSAPIVHTVFNGIGANYAW